MSDSQQHEAKIRVVLADDHHVVRSGIRSELDQQADIEVVGEATNGYGALKLVEKVQPDVLLLDINMPGLDGTEVTRQLADMANASRADEARQPVHVLILSAYCEPEYVYSLFALGAKGYLLKDEAPERIDDLIASLADFADPILDGTAEPLIWDPTSRSWQQ